MLIQYGQKNQLVQDLQAALNQNGVSCPAFIEVYSDMYRQIPELYESYDRVLTLYAQSKLAKEADFRP